MKYSLEFLHIWLALSKIRLARILLPIIFLVSPISAESIAQLKLMLQKKPDNPRILYHLAKLNFQTANYSKALFYYQKLHQVTGDHPEAVPGIAISLWRLGREYEAYATCRPNSELARCSKILGTIQDIRSAETPIFELRYTLETSAILDLQQAETLLKANSTNPLLIDTLAQYFLDSNLPEFALDFWSLIPGLLQTKVKIFQTIANQYKKLLSQDRELQLNSDESLFHAYYLWKFDPEAAERFPALARTKIRKKFETLVRQIGFDTFENYYRLGYLYHLENLDELRRNAFLRADEKAPFELYSFLIRQTMARLEKAEPAVALDLTTVEKLQAGPKSFRLAKGNKANRDSIHGNNSQTWYSPSTEEEFKKLLLEKQSSIYLEFCQPDQESCSNYQKNLLSSKDIKRELRGYTKIRINPSTAVGKELLRSFPVRDLPQIYLLDAGGSFRDEIAGPFDIQELLLKIRKSF